MTGTSVLVNPRRLFSIENNTRCHTWCGPGVLCVLTNQPMSIVRDVIKGVRHENGSARPLTGTSWWELIEAGLRMGFQIERSHRYERGEAPTVARWLRGKERDRQATYILTITYRRWTTGHWVIVRGNKFADSQTGGPVNLRDCPHRRKRVKRVYRVWQIGKKRKTAIPVYFKL